MRVPSLGPPPPRGGHAAEFSCFDPALARVAQESGLPAAELSEIQALLARRRGGLGDFTAKSPAAGAAFAESEGTGAGPEASPMEAAVVALTQIVADLAKQKKQAEKTPLLEAALDRAEGFSLLGEAGSSSSSGPLQNCSLPHPQGYSDPRAEPSLIYGAIERLLEEDLLQRRLGTSLAEARQRLVAGYTIAATSDRIPPQCVCAGLCVACGTRCVKGARKKRELWPSLPAKSLGGGSWLVAEQFCLEPAPPLASFSKCRSSHLDSIDSYHSRIFEPRWSELCLRKVRELEQNVEAKRKLGGKGRSAPPSGDGAPTSGAEKGEKGRKGQKPGPAGASDK